ncbi:MULTISPECIES: pyridoxamine 5'-phosphate oxidase family protein [Mumia]|uniref:pyridoxamine 5'-phosphate oxidase family protein n=1 Tax=Mumia TaxID=1546255 RepID=UPI00141EA213|nr:MULTISPECIES: pyridoxamine 5'-phosphate oxidase family protein [unclassified Mumia]QMW65591.1 pyridoxamine 5'-phosphate oxidase family protein [Mumia sp. ZJ1417]
MPVSTQPSAPVTEITSVDELRALVGDPLPRVRDKVRAELLEDHVAWLAASPFCLVSTSDTSGRCDVSPKGDPAGIGHVVDATTVAIPERPGNRRVDGFLNVLENPYAGLLFVVPGRGDTLRINGRARIVTDAPYFDALTVKGHRPILALEVAIEEVFFHCAKAFLRSRLWNQESWHPEVLASRAEVAQRLERPQDSLEALEAYYGEAYSKNLY